MTATAAAHRSDVGLSGGVMTNSQGTNGQRKKIGKEKLGD